MRTFSAAFVLLALVLLLLVGCTSTGQLTPQAMKSISDMCAQDAKLQPQAVIVAGVVGAAAPAAGPYGVAAGTALQAAVGVDSAVLHPAVQDVCKQVAAAPAPAK